MDDDMEAMPRAALLAGGRRLRDGIRRHRDSSAMTLSEEVRGVLHRAYLGAREAGHAPVADAEPETKPSAAFQRVVRSAMARTESDEREHLMPRDLFIALLEERDGLAGKALLEATRDPQGLEELRSSPPGEDHDAS